MKRNWYGLSVLVLFIVAFVIQACAPLEGYDSSGNYVGEQPVIPGGVTLDHIYSDSYSDVYRFDDVFNGNICYIYNGVQKGGISCVKK
jgi:hypothetical protein